MLLKTKKHIFNFRRDYQNDFDEMNVLCRGPILKKKYLSKRNVINLHKFVNILEVDILLYCQLKKRLNTV